MKPIEIKGESALGRHDQLFKDLLRTFFGDFLSLVMPSVAAGLDAEKAEFLDKETFTDLPRGRRRELDLVARVPLRRRSKGRKPGASLVLIHVEIERSFSQSFGRRLWHYYMQLVTRYGLSVLPIVVYLKGGPPGVELHRYGEKVLGFEVNRFQYHALGLSQATAEDWLKRPEPLAPALASLMKAGTLRSSEQKLACLQGIAKAELDEARRFLLVNAVETYLQLEEEEAERYSALMETEAEPEVRAMEMTWADKIEARGREAGMLAGIRQVVTRQLESRFGEVPRRVRDQLARIDDPERLQGLATRLLDAKSLQDLGLDSPS